MSIAEKSATLHALIDDLQAEAAVQITQHDHQLTALKGSLVELQANFDRTCRLLDEERRNCEQNALIIDTLRAEIAALKTKPDYSGLVEVLGCTPVVEEQGPWVIVGETDMFIDEDGDSTTTVRSAYKHKSREAAEKETGEGQRVITLAEARALVAAKTVAP